MTAPNETETIRVQSLITQAGVRLGTDAAFKTSYQSDPISALTGAGIPRDAVQHILRQVSKFKGEDEVSGYDDYDSSGGYHYTLDNPNNW